MSTKTGRSYTETFKGDAVRLVRELGYPVAQVAGDLGIVGHPSTGGERSSSGPRDVDRPGNLSGLSRRNWSNNWGTLKNELVHHRRYDTREQARREITEFIEVFYNRQRRHFRLGNRSPVAFAQQWARQQPAA